uniref:Uncharacterized protein n=1 Tax=Knipowitschia caucasica TaxID=637954 RepID=A0AAV2KQM3_KNICA
MHGMSSPSSLNAKENVMQLEKAHSNRHREVKVLQEENNRLLSQVTDLKHQLCRLETNKIEMEASLSQLKQELSESMKKLSKNTSAVEVNHQYCNSLEKVHTCFSQNLDWLTGSEKQTKTLKTDLSSSATSDVTIKHLEETVQRMLMEKTQLERAAQNQSFKLRTLEKQANEALKERIQLQELISNLQSSKFSLEEQLSIVKQKDSTLSHEGLEYQALWEKEVKKCSKFGLRLSELEKEKEQLSSKVETIKTKAKHIMEKKNVVETRLQDEMTRNSELHTEVSRLRTLVKTAKKKLRDKDMGEEKSREDVQGLLNKETQLRHQLEMDYGDLVKEVASLKRSLVDRQRTEEELRSHLEAAEREHSQVEERSRQQLQRKLDEVNRFFQTQNTSQKSLLSQMEHRIRELENQVSKNRCSEQDSIRHLDITQTELQRYRSMYSEERHVRKSLAAKLQQTDSRLSEAKLLLNELVSSPQLVGSRRH